MALTAVEVIGSASQEPQYSTATPRDGACTHGAWLRLCSMPVGWVEIDELEKKNMRKWDGGEIGIFIACLVPGLDD